MNMKNPINIEKVQALTEVERFETSSAENRRLLKQEELILEVTEALTAALNDSRITRSELAKRLGKTKGFVSQLLAGGRNLTLRTVSDIADAIGVSISIEVESSKAGRAKLARGSNPRSIARRSSGYARRSN